MLVPDPRQQSKIHFGSRSYQQVCCVAKCISTCHTVLHRHVTRGSKLLLLQSQHIHAFIKHMSFNKFAVHILLSRSMYEVLSWQPADLAPYRPKQVLMRSQ